MKLTVHERRTYYIIYTSFKAAWPESLENKIEPTYLFKWVTKESLFILLVPALQLDQNLYKTIFKRVHFWVKKLN